MDRSAAISTDGASVKIQMLQQAARLAAGEESEEAWYLVQLLQNTQPRELLRVCHFTLATFLELNYEYFDEGWPLQSRMDSPSTFAPVSASCQRSKKLRSKGGRFRSRSPLPAPNEQEVETVTPRVRPSIVDPTERSVPKSTSGKLSWLKGKSLLPSKLPVFIPTSSTPPEKNLERSMSIIASSAVCTTSASSSVDFGKHSQRLPHYENPDYVLCRYISDFLLESPDILSAEGLFRRPGSLSRSNRLYSELKECFTGGCVGSNRRILRSGVSQASLTSLPLTIRSTTNHIHNRPSERRAIVYGLLSPALVYDVASVLLRCLSSVRTKSTSDSGLIPPKATDLFVKATCLQYHLKDRHPVYALDPTTDWIHLLCHGRQLLAYRIIIQLLLPIPERQLFLKLLSLLYKIASNTLETRMSSEALARCLAFAVFGIPNDAVAMGCYIDTLINLIELYEHLETLPRVIYHQVRNYLKSKLGTSPMKKFTKVRVNQARVDSLPMDKSALKRSWATCQVSVDTSCTHLTSSTSRGKENRPLFLSHLCLWSKISPTKTRDSHTPSTPLRQSSSLLSPSTPKLSTPNIFADLPRRRPRAPSPFLVWKKQRSTLSMKKSKSFSPITDAVDRNTSCL